MVRTINDDMLAPQAIFDPYTYFGELRERDPIHWNEVFQQWIVTGYDDVVWMTRRHEKFSSQITRRDTRQPYPPIPAEDLDLHKFTRAFGAEMLIQHDRPAHLAMRTVFQAAFSPTSMEAWRPMARSIINGLLDEVEENGGMDVMHDFATPLPLLLITDMMGVPRDDRFLLEDLTKKYLRGGQPGPDRIKVNAQGAQGLLDYLSPLVAEKMSNPKDDLLSMLCEGERTGVFTRRAVLSNAALLLVAGHETSINLICNGVLAFIRHPSQWALLKGEPAGRASRAVEECLRYDPTSKSNQRIATEDIEIKGKTIRKNDAVRWIIASANRDPAVFRDPDVFDIQRYPNPHLAFGSGIHHCLGSALARIEGQEAFRALAERFDTLELQTDTLEYVPTLGFRSLVSLPVSWR